MWKRVFVILLAAWLIFSAFAWPHRPAHLVNTVVVGAGLVIFGALSTMIPWARSVIVALAAWLLVSVIVIPTMDATTFWNNALIALAVFVMGMLDSNRAFRKPAPRDQHA